MGTSVTSKLTKEQTDNLISDFRVNLGTRLKGKREKVNLSQKDLADCLDINQSTLSKYESGDRDMSASMLPLFSTYCKFPMYELFPRDVSKYILDTFSTAVNITVERKKRQINLQKRKESFLMEQKQAGEERILKAQVYEVNGKEVYEPVAQKLVSKSLREQYKDAELHTEFEPYTEKEFCDFIKSKGTVLVDSVINAGQFLMQIEDAPNKDTLKGAIADFIVDELVINQVAQRNSDELSRRAYAYYRLLYHQRMDNDEKYKDEH